MQILKDAIIILKEFGIFLFTAAIAISTYLTYKIYKKLHTDQYEAELVFELHPYTKEIKKALLDQKDLLSVKLKNLLPSDKVFGTQCIFVNPGGIPMIIERINISPEPLDKFFKPFFSNDEEGIYITTLPWVIKSGSFALFWAVFDTTSFKTNSSGIPNWVKVEVTYRSKKFGYRDVTLSGSVKYDPHQLN